MTQSKVLILQHVPWEKPGRILDSLDDLGMSYEIANVAKEKKPEPKQETADEVSAEEETPTQEEQKDGASA